MTIRSAQLRMLADRQMQVFCDETAAMLKRRRTDLPPDLPERYLAQLVTLSAARCHARQVCGQASIVAFAESLLNDDAQPMSPERMADKADEVERELDTRALFMQCQALEAALQEMMDQAADGASTSQSTQAAASGAPVQEISA